MSIVVGGHEIKLVTTLYARRYIDIDRVRIIVGT